MKTTTKQRVKSAAREPGPTTLLSQGALGNDDLDAIRSALAAAREQISMEVARREQTTARLEQRMDSERARMRKQLHDGLGQVLTSISFLTSSLRAKLARQGVQDTAELDEIASLINQAIAESRAIAATCDNTPASKLLGNSSRA